MIFLRVLRPTILLMLQALMTSRGLAAPAPGVSQYEAFFTQVVAEGNLSGLDQNLSRIRLWVEGQARFNNDNPMANLNWYQGLTRGALGYALDDRLTVWTGYTYLPTQNYGKGYVGEQDVWPAVRYIVPSAIGTFVLREMIDIRFVRGDAPGIRTRSLIRFMRPFSFEPRLGLVVWDEFYFNANNVDMAPRGNGWSGFNQNWGFLGLSWNFNENTRAELGYLSLLSNSALPGQNYNSYGNLNTIYGSVFLGW
jgi:Protein of unknown function (DUF2490)